MDTMEKTLAEITREKGEQDGNTYRLWFDEFNGVCNISGHTDILCAHLGEDGILTFQLNTPDDKSTVFVRLGELPIGIQKKVIDKILDYPVLPEPRIGLAQ